MAVITPDRHYSVTGSKRREKTPLPPFNPEIHAQQTILAKTIEAPEQTAANGFSIKIPLTRTRVVFGEYPDLPRKPAQKSPPNQPSPLTRFVDKSREWLQTRGHNKESRPTFKRALGAFALKAEQTNQNIQRKTKEFFSKPRRVIGALALVGVLAGGAGVVSAMDRSTPERASVATELTDLGNETATVTEITDRDRLESWAEDHPDADIEEAFGGLATASDYELKLVYDQEVEKVIDGVYGPYDGQFPDWLL